MLTGRRILAREALASGLVQRLVEPGEPPGRGPGQGAARSSWAPAPKPPGPPGSCCAGSRPCPGPDLHEATAQAIAAARASQEGQAGLAGLLRPGRAPVGSPGRRLDVPAPGHRQPGRDRPPHPADRAGPGLHGGGGLHRPGPGLPGSCREADAVLAVESFLDPAGIVAAGPGLGRASLLHPGYGFLSEDAGLRRRRWRTRAWPSWAPPRTAMRALGAQGAGQGPGPALRRAGAGGPALPRAGRPGLRTAGRRSWRPGASAPRTW